MAPHVRAANALGGLQAMATGVGQRLEEWRALSGHVVEACERDPQESGAVSVDFLAYSAYVLLAAMWLQAAVRAQATLATGSAETAFYRAKLDAQRSTGGGSCPAPLLTARPCWVARIA